MYVADHVEFHSAYSTARFEGPFVLIAAIFILAQAHGAFHGTWILIGNWWLRLMEEVATVRRGVICLYNVRAVFQPEFFTHRLIVSIQVN